LSFLKTFFSYSINIDKIIVKILTNALLQKYLSEQASIHNQKTEWLLSKPYEFTLERLFKIIRYQAKYSVQAGNNDESGILTSFKETFSSLNKCSPAWQNTDKYKTFRNDLTQM